MSAIIEESRPANRAASVQFESGAAAEACAEYEVLVVGFGPVGATLANLLGRHGVQTLVVDKAEAIYTAPRAIALDNEALRILQMAGVPAGTFDTVAIPYVRMRSPLIGEFARFNTAGSIDGHPRLVTFYQPQLEQALRARLREWPCVATELGAELLGFDQDASGVNVLLRRADGCRRTVRARYLIGADGASSLVRKLIGQAFSGETYPEQWLVVDAHNVAAPIDHVEFLCDPCRPTPHMVAPGQRERWEFMLQPGETQQQMESEASMRRLLSRWGDPDRIQVERKAVYCFHARAAKSFRQARVFLAGDAAHITPPFVGQGLVSGLRDAANLAWKLAWVLRGRAAAPVLDSYDIERRPHAIAMIRLAKMMGQLVMPSNRLIAMLVHSALWLTMHVPGLRGFMANQGPKPQNRFPHGLFVPGKSGARRLIRGGQLPQGWLRGANGALQLSDDVLSCHLSLIGFGVDPASALTAADAAALQAVGAVIVQICYQGQRPTDEARGRAWEDVADVFIPATAAPGWIALVRPDLTVIHDGPIEQLARILDEGLRVLGAAAPAVVDVSTAAA